MSQTLNTHTLKLQEKLDSKFPELELSPLVRELRSRFSFMPQIAIDMSWVKRAACRGKNNSIFFPEGTAGVKLAKQYCARCEVRNECLEYALLNRIEQGVWGGTSERQRTALLKERKSYVEVEISEASKAA